MVFTAMHLCNDHCQPKPVSAADSLASDGGSVGNLSLPPKDHLPCVRMLRRPQREGHGQANGLQVNAQEIMPTSHCAILRASPMLQAPSPFTSHASGWVSWLHWRTPTSNWATTSASPMLTTSSPLTSPHGAAAIGVVVVPASVVVVVVATAAQTAGSVGSASAKSRAQSW